MALIKSFPAFLKESKGKRIETKTPLKILNMLKTKKMSKKSKIDFESMLCDKYRFEIPVDYDDMQNKKLRIYNYQTNDSYLFTYSSRHGERMNVDTFFMLLKREGIIG